MIMPRLCIAIVVPVSRISVSRTMASLASPSDICKCTRVLDIRPAAERASSGQTIAGAACVTWNREKACFDESDDDIAKALPSKDECIAVHCKTGGRVSTALGVLKSMGYENVFNAGGPDGGQEQWEALKTLAK